MATTIEQQVAMDEALVPSTQRLRIRRSNLRLPSDIQSKESTLQLVYDVLCRCPFFKGLYHERNIDYAFLIWEDFVYQVEHKNHKKSNEMYYPRFTKVIIHHVMSKDQSIPRINKINWHYVRDDSIFSTIKVVFRHQNTQHYGVMLPIELTNDEIRNTKAYKEYYAFSTGEAAPKPKASARRKRSGSDTSITPPTATTTPKTTVTITPKLTATAKDKQPAKAKSLSDLSEVARTEAQQLKIVLRRSRQQTHISQPGGSGTDEGTGSKPGVPDVPTDESEEELSWNSSDDEGADDQEKVGDDDEGDEGNDREEREEDDDEEDKDGAERDDDDEDQEITKDDEQDDTERSGDDTEEGNSDAEDNNEETRDEDNFDPIPRTPKSSEDEGYGEEDQGLNVNEEEHVEDEEEDELYRDVNINQGRGLQAILEGEDTHVTLTPINSNCQQGSSSVSLQFVTSMLNLTTDVVFRFDDRLKSLEDNFSELRQTNSFAEAVFAIPSIVHQYMNQQMNEAVRVAVQIQTGRLREAYQRENDEFLQTIDENMKRIIKEQVKGQVKEQVSRILPRIKQSVNAQLEAEVLTRSSHSSRTSYAVAADLSEMELKKILIEKMEGNKSIQRSDEQRKLYKALVDTYEADKLILDSYGETVILKRRRDDDDDQDEGPSAGSDRGSKR
nr:hypothetical protein [Tanacetum cinerariifolium]